jgi:hypothetical protein
MSCPLRMSDGRPFTNYNPRCAFNSFLNDKLNENNMIKSSYEMRLYLQKNHDEIVRLEREAAIKNVSPCTPCAFGELINDKNPELANKYLVKNDGINCYKSLVNNKGLGTSGFF